MNVTAPGMPSAGGRPRSQAQGTSRGCVSLLCRDERRGAPGSWGGCDELVWTIRRLAGRRGPWAEEQGGLVMGWEHSGEGWRALGQACGLAASEMAGTTWAQA